MKTIKIYTDGACSGNQNQLNKGGWGAILEYGSLRKELYGGEENTTNNRMEMKALLNALSAIKQPGYKIHVFSDSSYLIECFRKQWYLKWQSNNWQTSKNSPVENRDLWEPLISFLSLHTLTFFRVKGHVDPKKTKLDLDKVYQKFLAWNGDNFTFEDFLYITEQNNRADKLANMGMESLSLT